MWHFPVLCHFPVVDVTGFGIQELTALIMLTPDRHHGETHFPTVHHRSLICYSNYPGYNLGGRVCAHTCIYLASTTVLEYYSDYDFPPRQADVAKCEDRTSTIVFENTSGSLPLDSSVGCRLEKKGRTRLSLKPESPWNLLP